MPELRPYFDAVIRKSSSTIEQIRPLIDPQDGRYSHHSAGEARDKGREQFKEVGKEETLPSDLLDFAYHSPRSSQFIDHNYPLNPPPSSLRHTQRATDYIPPSPTTAISIRQPALAMPSNAAVGPNKVAIPTDNEKRGLEQRSDGSAEEVENTRASKRVKDLGVTEGLLAQDEWPHQNVLGAIRVQQMAYGASYNAVIIELVERLARLGDLGMASFTSTTSAQLLREIPPTSPAYDAVWRSFMGTGSGLTSVTHRIQTSRVLLLPPFSPPRDQACLAQDCRAAVAILLERMRTQPWLRTIVGVPDSSTNIESFRGSNGPNIGRLLEKKWYNDDIMGILSSCLKSRIILLGGGVDVRVLACTMLSTGDAVASADDGQPSKFTRDLIAICRRDRKSRPGPEKRITGYINEGNNHWLAFVVDVGARVAMVSDSMGKITSRDVVRLFEDFVADQFEPDVEMRRLWKYQATIIYPQTGSDSSSCGPLSVMAMYAWSANLESLPVLSHPPTSVSTTRSDPILLERVRLELAATFLFDHPIVATWYAQQFLPDVVKE